MLRIFSRSSGKYHFCTRALSNPYVCHVALYADQYQLYPATCRGNKSSDNNTMTDSVSSLFFFYLLKYMFYIQKSFGPRQKMYIYFFNFASPSMGFKTTCNKLFSCDFFLQPTALASYSFLKDKLFKYIIYLLSTCMNNPN